MQDHYSIYTACGALQFDAAVGNIPRLRFHWEGRSIEPLYAAPWREEPEIQNDHKLPLVDRRLAGDFFCAPFGAAADTGVPPHGWSANSRWDLLDQEPGRMRLALVRDIKGARITKSLEIAGDAPLLYQEHRIEGGEGLLPVAHHPMIRLEGNGRFSASRKRAIMTPAETFEPASSCLAYPTRSAELTKVARADGRPVDLTRWPIHRQNEDFVTLVEAPGKSLGWSAVVRDDEDDIVFFLKDPAVLPITMLWFSNGGRDYPPWSGRFAGVTGIEDGCCAGPAGETAASRPNPITTEGAATGLKLAEGRSHVVRHVTGAVPRPAGWTEILDIAIEGDRLAIRDCSGGEMLLPWRPGFLKGRLQ